MLSAQDYAVAQVGSLLDYPCPIWQLQQIALKGIDHIEATAKKITKIRNAEADDAHRPRHDLSDFLRARNSYGDESSTAVMTPKTEAWFEDVLRKGAWCEIHCWAGTKWNLTGYTGGIGKSENQADVANQTNTDRMEDDQTERCTPLFHSLFYFFPVEITKYCGIWWRAPSQASSSLALFTLINLMFVVTSDSSSLFFLLILFLLYTLHSRVHRKSLHFVSSFAGRKWQPSAIEFPSQAKRSFRCLIHSS